MADTNLPVSANQEGTPEESLPNAPVVAEDATGTSVAEIPDEGETDNKADNGGEELYTHRHCVFATIKDFVKNGETMRRIVILGFLVIFIGAIIFTIVSLQSPSSEERTERMLGHYSPAEIGQVLDYLDANKFEYRLTGSDTIVVNVKDYSKITEGMLRNGIALPAEQTDEGDAILMTDSGFGVSQRLENERIKHGREIQLARAIERIDGIEHATVLLAIPRDNVFAREKNHPSASVVLTLKGNAYISPENVNSVRYMVASSVHNLMAKDVTVTDQSGRLLSAEPRGDSTENKLQRDFEMRTMREAQYRDKLDSILGPMLGLGNYSAEVDVTLDTTVQEETSQLYNPDNQAIRSETLSEKTGNDDKGNPYGVPGSLSNQPPANAAIPQELKDGTATATRESANNRQESREAVRNYEVDTTVRHTVRPSNVVQRLTVSVAVDYMRLVDADGLVSYEPRPQEDLDKIADLVRGGLGLNENRGDVVHVETVSFPHNDDLPPQPWYMQDYFYRLACIGGAVLVILILVIFVIRPMLNKLLRKDVGDEDAELDEDLDGKSALEGNDDLNLIAQDNELADQVYTINHEGGIELPNLHKEADLLKAVRTLASDEPQLTAEVIKEWLEADMNKDKSS